MSSGRLFQMLGPATESSIVVFNSNYGENGVVFTLQYIWRLKLACLTVRIKGHSRSLRMLPVMGGYNFFLISGLHFGLRDVAAKLQLFHTPIPF